MQESHQQRNRYWKGYRDFSELISSRLKQPWKKLGIFSFYDQPYIETSSHYLGPKQALVAVAENSMLWDSAKVFVIDSLQGGEPEFDTNEGFQRFLSLFDEIFPDSAKYYFGPMISDRKWMHELSKLKIPLSWLIKRPNIFAEVLSDASPIGEIIGPGDAAFEDLFSMHEVLVNKLGPPSLTEEVLGKVRDRESSEYAGEAAGLMASLISPATAVSRGVRYLSKFMSILMDRRKQEVKEVYEEWKQRVVDTYSMENLRQFFDETDVHSCPIVNDINEKRVVLIILETRDSLYDLFLPLVLQHLVEEVGYIPPHRRRRKAPKKPEEIGNLQYDWDSIQLTYDEIDESDLPPVTDKLIKEIMEDHKEEQILLDDIEGEFEGKPRTAMFFDSATHISKFTRSFRFALRLPEKHPNISVAAVFHTASDTINKTLEEGVLEYITERAFVFDLHPILYDKATLKIPISRKARLQSQLQEMTRIWEGGDIALLEFNKEADTKWDLLCSPEIRRRTIESKRGLMGKIRLRLGEALRFRRKD